MGGKLPAPLLRRQDGLVTRQQLLELGWGPDRVDHVARRGWLHRVHRGVYSVTPVLTPRARWRAATLATGGTLSHGSAAALHRLLPERSAAVEIVLGSHVRGRPGLVIRETRNLPAADVVSRAGIPVTSPTRTVLDLAQTVDRDTVLAAAMEALHLGVLDTRRILGEDLRGRRGASSVHALRRRLVEQTRTELESAMRELCLRGGLPSPDCQRRIAGLRPDFSWPAHRLAVETDGWATHGTRRAFENDRARDARLAAHGWEVLRFTWRQVTEQPDLVLRALHARLG